MDTAIALVGDIFEEEKIILYKDMSHQTLHLGVQRLEGVMVILVFKLEAYTIILYIGH